MNVYVLPADKPKHILSIISGGLSYYREYFIQDNLKYCMKKDDQGSRIEYFMPITELQQNIS